MQKSSFSLFWASGLALLLSACPPSSPVGDGGPTVNADAGENVDAVNFDGGFIDPCVDMSCDEHASCSSSLGVAICSCDEGYEDIDGACVEIDGCLTDPCDVNASCSSSLGVATCACNEGYVDIDGACVEIDGCLGRPCDEHASCSSSLGVAICSCDEGYEDIDGACVEIDGCLGRPCDVNASCSSSLGVATCACNEGYEGTGEVCAEIDGCLTDPCDVNASCSSSLGVAICSCDEGYEDIDGACVEIDGCLGRPCDEHASCSSSLGVATCSCDEGYEGTGEVCTEIDACLTNPCDVNASCSSSLGVATCTCDTGYEGTGEVCTEIDACLTNPCDENASCSSSLGVATCTCDTGYEGTGEVCTDVDECTLELDDCADTERTCVNTIGSYSCLCARGEYYSEPSGRCFQDREYTADISQRPAELVIDGVGTYLVSGLGSVYLYANISRSPIKGDDRFFITDYKYRDLIFANITAKPGSILSDLEAWISTGLPIDGYLRIEGPNLERLSLLLTSMSVIERDSDLTVSSEGLTKLKVSVRKISRESYTPPGNSIYSPNDVGIEIDGVGNYRFSTEDLNATNAGEIDPIYMRNAINKTNNSGAINTDTAEGLMNWFFRSARDFERGQIPERRQIIQIYRNSSGVEFGRVNCYNSAITRLVLFNPYKEFLIKPLTDAVVDVEICENG